MEVLQDNRIQLAPCLRELSLDPLQVLRVVKLTGSFEVD